MKKISLIISCLLVTSIIYSQTKPKPAVAVKKPVAAIAAKPAFSLKTASDSLSYAIGILDGNFFKTQGLASVNAAAIGQGFSDVVSGKTILTTEQADQLVRKELQKNAKLKCQPLIDEGKKFMSENAKKPGVKQTESGLQYEVIVEGNGTKPADTSMVKVHYQGTLLNGQEFDSSIKRGEPATFPLNRVIRGWTEGLQLMHVGSKYKFYIPYNLGYGEQGYGEAIPGGATLIFEVELLEIVNG